MFQPESDEMLVQAFVKYGFKVAQQAAKQTPSSAPIQKAVKVFPVPEVPAGFKFTEPTLMQGTKNRLNAIPKVWDPPATFLKKKTTQYNVGNLLRVSEVIQNYQEYIDKIVNVAGWARTVRAQENNTLVFIELSDGTGFKGIQVVVRNNVPNFQDLLKSNTGYSYKITGLLVKSPAQGQPVEILVDAAQGHQCFVFGTANPKEYPMAKGQQNVETLREKAHLRPRSNLIGAVTRIRNNLAYATHQFFQYNGCLYIHTPIITASDCEGAGEMFQVTTTIPHSNLVKEIKTLPDGSIDYSFDFFKKPAMLTVSGQLDVETFCCALSNVYTFGPTFRAENSNTSRHLAEFWMIEPELAFADLFDNMDCAEAYVKFCLRYILENNLSDLEFLDLRVSKGLLDYLKEIVSHSFARCSYSEAVDMLIQAQLLGAKFEKKVSWGIDLGSEHERFMAEKVFKKPVFLYNYPKGIKAFYMKVTEDGQCVRAMDLLIPKIGELIGGSQREENLEVLEKRILEMGLNLKDYWWYLDLRRYGTVPHSGFGLGFERLVMMATGVDNIRDVIPFPRYPGNAEF